MRYSVLKGVCLSGTSRNVFIVRDDRIMRNMMTVDGVNVVMCPMFEIASNPTIDLREMEEYRMKKNGILVVYGEIEV
jgi:hypothetical protein